MTPRLAVIVMASTVAMAGFTIPATSSSTYPKDLAAEKAAADKGEVVGRWIEPGIGGYGLITIRKKGTGFVILAKPPGKAEEEITTLTEKRSKQGRQFDVGNETHDRYTIKPDGSLDISDDSGLIDKAKPVPATMIDQKLIDKAITSTYVKTNSTTFAIPITKTESLTTGAEYFVRPRLRDPESGQFSGLHGVTTGKADYFCGSVNAKNGFGGYSGAQRFAVIVSGSFVGQVFFEQQTPRTSFEKYWAMCGG